MAIQSKILTRQETADIKNSSGVVVQTVTAGVGTLALGKPGDIIERAYGPVIRPGTVTADTEFGAYVAGKGILVNSNDCVGVGLKFETVKTLSNGQVGSFLVSGACVIKRTQYTSALTAGMNIQYKDAGIEFDASMLDSDPWVEYAAWESEKAYAKGQYVTNTVSGVTKLYIVTDENGILVTDTTFPTAKVAEVGTLVGTEAAFSTTGDYTKAFCQVTNGGKKYSNLEPIDDDVFVVEVNGFKA